jgi:hypothetical protein
VKAAGFLRRGAPAFAALLLIFCMHWILVKRLGADAMAVGGATVELTPHLSRFLGYYLVFGGISMLLLAWGLQRLFPLGAEAIGQRLGQGSDRTFVAAVSLLAFAVAALIHRYLLQGMPLTDDETAYRFASEILAKGRLYLAPDPDKDFFDHLFVVNEGRVYTQYFLGWPALLLPFLLAGLTEYANPFYFALTVPAVFLILRRLAGPLWARAGALLLVASPMLAITAGTLLSHTSCTAALAWFLYCALRCREENSAWYWHAALAATFCVAFMNRPLSALGLGLPVLVSWLWDLRRSRNRWRDLLAFAAPAAAGAALFLLINAELTGHPLRSPYQSYLSYFTDGDMNPLLGEVTFISPAHSLAIVTATFFRLNFATLGWPCSWLFVVFAGAGPYRRVLRATVFTFFAANIATVHIGIDTYAPMHFIELGLPLVLLTVLGLERTTRWARDLERRLAATAEHGSRPRLLGIPALLAASSAIVASLYFFPYQAMALWKSADLEKLARAGLEELPAPAVLFVKYPYNRQQCVGRLPAGWVRAPPINHPDLKDDYLWLAHLDLARDRELMARRFPDRSAFVAFWTAESCVRFWVPLDAATEAVFPPETPQMFVNRPRPRRDDQP